MLSYIIYIFSISLQVAGALLLVAYGISTKRDDVIKKFSGNGIIRRDNDTNEIYYNEKAFFQEYKMAYIDKLSFIYILSGYLLGVLGELKDTEAAKDIALIIIAIVSLFIMFASNKLVEVILSKSNKVSKITNEDLVRIGIEPDMQNIPSSEIEKMFNDVFKE